MALKNPRALNNLLYEKEVKLKNYCKKEVQLHLPFLRLKRFFNTPDYWNNWANQLMGESEEKKALLSLKHAWDNQGDFLEISPTNLLAIKKRLSLLKKHHVHNLPKIKLLFENFAKTQKVHTENLEKLKKAIFNYADFIQNYHAEKTHALQGCFETKKNAPQALGHELNYFVDKLDTLGIKEQGLKKVPLLMERSHDLVQDLSFERLQNEQLEIIQKETPISYPKYYYFYSTQAFKYDLAAKQVYVLAQLDDFKSYKDINITSYYFNGENSENSEKNNENNMEEILKRFDRQQEIT